MLDEHEAGLARTALDNVIVARSDPDGVWPPGTLEAAHRALAELTGEPLPPEPEPEPEPEPPPPSSYEDPRDYLQGFAGVCHWDGDVRATDWYPAPRGTPFALPVPVFVQVLQTPGPMGTPLLTAVADCPEGPWAGWRFLMTHAEAIQPGFHPATEPFFTIGRSGIEMLPGEPDHVHFFCDAPGGGTITADGKGDISANAVLQGLGFQVQIVDRIPGPDDYRAGRAYAGRFL